MNARHSPALSCHVFIQNVSQNGDISKARAVLTSLIDKYVVVLTEKPTVRRNTLNNTGKVSDMQPNYDANITLKLIKFGHLVEILR